MKVCVTTRDDKGMDSFAFGHLGSAPYAVVHDTGSGETKSCENKPERVTKGIDHRLATSRNEMVEAVVVDRIGRRALKGLHAMGIRVYQSVEGTVQENVNALMAGTLTEVPPWRESTLSEVASRRKGHKLGPPNPETSPKSYRRYLKRLAAADVLLQKGHIPPLPMPLVKVTSVVSGGLPSLGKR